jgi:hypothetical protein
LYRFSLLRYLHLCYAFRNYICLGLFSSNQFSMRRTAGAPQINLVRRRAHRRLDTIASTGERLRSFRVHSLSLKSSRTTASNPPVARFHSKHHFTRKPTRCSHASSARPQPQGLGSHRKLLLSNSHATRFHSKHTLFHNQIVVRHETAQHATSTGSSLQSWC